MAVADLNLSRRAVLGAALAAPVLSGVEGPLSPSFPRKRESSPVSVPDHHASVQANWREALAAYRAAAAELQAYERRTAGAPWEAQAAIEAAHGDLSDALYEALRRLLKAAAPNLAALALKLDLVVEHEVGTLTGGEQCLAALRRDARRLSAPPLPSGETA